MAPPLFVLSDLETNLPYYMATCLCLVQLYLYHVYRFDFMSIMQTLQPRCQPAVSPMQPSYISRERGAGCQCSHCVGKNRIYRSSRSETQAQKSDLVYATSGWSGACPSTFPVASDRIAPSRELADNFADSQ